ncbi:hypothetical protein D3C86_1748660 [compost metagenome]
MRDVEVTAGRIEILQRNESASIRVDAVSHFGHPFVFDSADAILAAGSFLLGMTRSKDRAKGTASCQFFNTLIFIR